MPSYRPIAEKPDHAAIEHAILELWERERTFEQLREQIRGGEPYSFIDGPITANNPMGVHHAWGRTYKDLFQRYHAMQGRDQRYQNGFDCQGLWVEVEVEKELGFNSKREIEAYGLDKFCARCRDRVAEYAAYLPSSRSGSASGWTGTTRTSPMTDNNIEHIWHFLKTCHEKGWLYTGRRPMPWCIRCGTVLSQHELVGTDSYRDLTHPSVFVYLPLPTSTDEALPGLDDHALDAAGERALAVHPDARLRQGRRRAGNDLCAVAARRRRCSARARRVVEPAKGSRAGRPALRRAVRRAAGPAGRRAPGDRLGGWSARTRAPASSTSRPGCGAEDYELSESTACRSSCRSTRPATTSTASARSRPHIRETNPPIFDDLEREGRALPRRGYTHRYPTCWRCGEELAFRAGRRVVHLGRRDPRAA